MKQWTEKETADMNDTLTVEIPDEVRDNSETVTDYAFMRHRSPDRGVVGPNGRDYELRVVRDHLSHMYEVYSWLDVNQGNRQGWGAGQRCRFDMIVNRKTGAVAYLFHTEYWTRVACSYGASYDDHCHSYATHYARIQHSDGTSTTRPLCDEALRWAQRAGESVTVSERLLIGQHD